jgi:transcriptional regulator with XRE-family HTH domain
MTTTPEGRTATLSELIAEEIGALLGRRRWSQAQLARAIGRTPMWVSLRLRGQQPFDVDDLVLIAGALSVGVHDLLPPPEQAARAAIRRPAIPRYLDMAVRPDRPADNRPAGHPATNGGARTARLPRGRRPAA